MNLQDKKIIKAQRPQITNQKNNEYIIKINVY